MTRILAVALIATSLASWLLLRRAEKRRKLDVMKMAIGAIRIMAAPDKVEPRRGDTLGAYLRDMDGVDDCTTSYDPHLYPLRPTMLALGA